MTRIKKHYSCFTTTAAVTAFFFLFLTGCGGGGVGEGHDNWARPLVGRWRLQSVAALGQTLNCPGSLSVPGIGGAACTDNDVVQFNRDGTFTASGNVTVTGIPLPTTGIPTSGRGTWQLSGQAQDTLTVTVTEPVLTTQPQSGNAQVEYSGNNLILTATQDGVSVTSTFVRTP